MPNNDLQELAKTVSSDEYDRAAGDRIKSLQNKWDLLEAKEGLQNHLVISGFMKELESWGSNIDTTLLEMDVTDEKTKLFRFKLKSDKEIIRMFKSIFDKSTRKSLENSIKFAKIKVQNKGKQYNA